MSIIGYKNSKRTVGGKSIISLSLLAVTICWSKTAQLQQSGIVEIVRTDFTNCPISTGKLHTVHH